MGGGDDGVPGGTAAARAGDKGDRFFLTSVCINSFWSRVSVSGDGGGRGGEGGVEGRGLK